MPLTWTRMRGGVHSSPHPKSLVHSQLTQLLQERARAGRPSLPVSAPGTYWARRQPRISPSERLQTCSTLVKCRHGTPGPKLCEVEVELSASSGAEHEPLALGPRRRGEARRAPDSLPPSLLPLCLSRRRIKTSGDSRWGSSHAASWFAWK